jgi:4-diphosphocytidyl-2-C-methyl-D-erythritol kinase
MRIKSFAKINLGLEVIRRRPDGYHDIRTLFQWIRLSDVLDFRETSSPEIKLEGNDPTIPWDETNLIFKAARLLRERGAPSQGAEVCAEKNIPAGRGLAGGSSNAAMTLLVLNRLWRLGLSRETLAGLGSRLGADVPFFLYGGLCLGEERGDRLTELTDLPPLFVVLAVPPFPVPTPQIYGALLPSSLTSPGEESKISRFLETRDLGFLENRLEDTIFRLYPQLVEYKSLFRNHGAELSLVTGSGSAVYGLFRDRGRAERCLADARKRGEAVLTETVTRLQGWHELEAGVSPSGKAADFGSAIRGFESSRPSFDISNDETKD